MGVCTSKKPNSSISRRKKAMTCARNTTLSFTFLFLISKKRYLRRRSSRVSLEVIISKGSCSRTLPKTRTDLQFNSIVPVGILGL